MGQARIGIVGIGPVGAILAVHLQQNNYAPHLVEVSPELVGKIKKDGIHLSGLKTLHADFLHVHDTIKNLQDLQLDYIFFCVKAHVLPLIKEELAPLYHEKTCFVSFQNGIDVEEVLVGLFPASQVLRGVINYAGMNIGPGLVKMTFFNPPNHIGNLVPPGREKAEAVARILQACGLETSYTENIKKEAWRKSLLNSILMPVSLLTRLTMGKVMGLETTRSIVEGLLSDFLGIARAEGHDFGENFSDQAINYLVQGGDHKPSMLMDFELGQPLEIEFLNGKLQEYAKKHGIPSPSNQLLLGLIAGLLHQRNIDKNPSRP